MKGKQFTYSNESDRLIAFSVHFFRPGGGAGQADDGRVDGQAGKIAGHKDVRAERPLMKFLDAEASERRECIHPPRLNARLQRPTKSQECESETDPK